MSLLSMQIRAGMLILMIILIRRQFLHNLSKGALKGMWAIVLLRLILPFSRNVVAGFSLPFDKPFAFPFINGAPVSSSQQSAVFSDQSLYLPVIAFYLAVCLIMVSYFIAVHICCRKIYRYAYPSMADATSDGRTKRNPCCLRHCESDAHVVRFG